MNFFTRDENDNSLSVLHAEVPFQSGTVARFVVSLNNDGANRVSLTLDQAKDLRDFLTREIVIREIKSS